MAWIYILENKINGKCYVGQTIQELYRRLTYHRYSSEYPIGNAIRYYGWNNFNIYSFECDECDLDYFEIGFIRQMKTLSPNGYNLTLGGNKNKIVSKQTKLKMSKNHYDVSGKNNPFYGKKHTKESKMKMSESSRGQRSWCVGKTFSKEYRKKLSEAHKGKMTGIDHLMFGKHHSKKSIELISKNNKMKRKIKCIETGEIFDSIALAQEKYIVTHIYSACGKSNRTAAGYHWEYV